MDTDVISGPTDQSKTSQNMDYSPVKLDVSNTARAVT